VLSAAIISKRREPLAQSTLWSREDAVLQRYSIENKAASPILPKKEPSWVQSAREGSRECCAATILGQEQGREPKDSKERAVEAQSARENQEKQRRGREKSRETKQKREKGRTVVNIESKVCTWGLAVFM
jgi:hypothetical protein